MKVKICGITTQDAADQAIQAGADFIGFVFAKSKRRIDPQAAAAIAKKIPATVKKVGVFVNEDVTTMEAIAETVGLDYIQLHGDETPEVCKQLSRPVIKAFQIASKDDLVKISDYQCDYFLLDSPAGKYRGGNGETFDWRVTKDMSTFEGKIILAGGLHQENVQEAIQEVNPAAVDVSSGVETNGQKDKEKIVAFIREAKRTGDRNGNVSAAK